VVVEPDALRALLRNDVEDIVRDRGVHRPVRRLPLDPALVDRGVGALRLTRPAVDALVRDDRRHGRTRDIIRVTRPSNRACPRPRPARDDHSWAMTLLRLPVPLLAAPAASVRAAGDHELLAAQMELKIARDHLQAAGTEYAGHRRAAMQHIDDALREIRQALD